MFTVSPQDLRKNKFANCQGSSARSAPCRTIGLGQAGPTQCDKPFEFASAENPIGRHGQIGKGDQPQGPGHGALRRPCFHSGFDCADKTYYVKDCCQDSKQLYSHSIFP